MNAKFLKNQGDLTIDDVKVVWAGSSVLLFRADRMDRPLTVLSVDNAVAKIIRWCVKNAYRCSQIQNGRIML